MTGNTQPFPGNGERKEFCQTVMDTGGRMADAGVLGVSDMKKRIVVCAVAAFAVFLVDIAAGQEEEVLTNADVVALSEAGLPASVIAAKIKASKTDFDTSVEQLVALSKAGVDGAVIEAMVNAKGPSRTQPRAEAAGSREAAASEDASLERAAPQPGETMRRSRPPVPQPGGIFSDALRAGGQGPEMVVIPAGSFRMGCVSGLDCFEREKPVHTVTIRQPFAVSKYEITFEDYDRFTYPNKVDDEGWGRARRPIINVSWNDAKEYVAWLSSQTGQTYRLLTEAEWEYAARAGTSTKYHFGNSESQLCRYANFADKTVGFDDAPCSDGVGGQTAVVGRYAANAYGLHDMHGNVWEWVEDCWNDSYSGAPSNGDAWLRGNCERRVLRGGSWLSDPGLLRSAFRGGLSTGDRDLSLGFRVARTLTP